MSREGGREGERDLTVMSFSRELEKSLTGGEFPPPIDPRLVQVCVCVCCVHVL